MSRPRTITVADPSVFQNRPLFFFASTAKALGVNSAILYQLIVERTHHAEDFIKDPRQKGDFYQVRENKIWVKFSYAEFEEKMPWLSETTLKRIVRELKNKEILFSKQLFVSDYDGTNWYHV